MSVGKYSPTVGPRYDADQEWFKKDSEDGLYDSEGYDMYGYNAEGFDRDGKTEWDYLEEWYRSTFLFDEE